MRIDLQIAATGIPGVDPNGIGLAGRRIDDQVGDRGVVVVGGHARQGGQRGERRDRQGLYF
ncbi:MAG: hypothetical protein P8X52_01740, partial [Limibacillus sp.]